MNDVTAAMENMLNGVGGSTTPEEPTVCLLYTSDCRVFGCIPLEKIEGKVWIRFWPLKKFGHLD